MDHQTLHTQYEALKQSTTKRLKTFNAMIRQERKTNPVNQEKMDYLKLIILKK